jgi:hypothetical protein
MYENRPYQIGLIQIYVKTAEFTHLEGRQEGFQVI